MNFSGDSVPTSVDVHQGRWRFLRGKPFDSARPSWSVCRCCVVATKSAGIWSRSILLGQTNGGKRINLLVGLLGYYSSALIRLPFLSSALAERRDPSATLSADLFALPRLFAVLASDTRTRGDGTVDARVRRISCRGPVLRLGRVRHESWSRVRAKVRYHCRT